MKKILLLIFILYNISAFSQDKQLDSMLLVLKTAKDDTNKVLLLDDISFYLANQNVDRARKYAAEELALAQKLNYPMSIAISYNIRGIIETLAGNFDVALEYYFKCLEVWEKLKDTAGISKTLHNISTIYAELGDLDKSLEYTLKSLKLKEELKDKRGQAFCFTHLGAIYTHKKEYFTALENYTKAIAIRKELGDKKGLAETYISAGITYFEMKNYKSAHENYNLCLKNIEELNDTNILAKAVINIGQAYVTEKKYDSALVYLQKGLRYATICGNNLWRKNVYGDIVELYDSLKDYKNEKMYLLKYIALNDSMYTSEKANAIAEMRTKYETEKKEAENVSLLQQNEIQSLKINNNHYIIASLAVLFLISVVITFLIFSQNKLRFQQRTSQLEQRLLRSQMNPHFIFNSLQAIQNFISDKKAIKYLSSFGALTRSILENSRLESIPLSKEIRLLENYLELQKLLHEQQFNYVINVAHDLDPDEINIPPMLSQPFIENAVEYGMRDIESGGLIEISFSYANDMLFLEIKDNGMGLSIDKDKKHMSLATTITKERINFFNKKHRQKASFNITEAFPTEIRKGVMVNFSIPI